MSKRLFTKESLARLTPAERGDLMRLQMSESYGSRSNYLPEDCSQCGACGEPTLGSGWCRECYARFEGLRAKALAEKEEP